MKQRNKIFVFLAASIVIAVLVTIPLAFLSDGTMRGARKSCDTITINATYDAAAKRLACEQSITYRNRTDTALDVVKFHIYANAYKDGAQNPPVEGEKDILTAYPNGKSFGGITIGALNVNGVRATPIIDGDDETILVVPLATALARGRSVTINMDYVVSLANIKHRLGWTADAVNLANFYPVPVIYENGAWQTYPYSASGDPFYNALHNFRVTLSCAQNFTAASSGTLIKETKHDGLRAYTLHADAIRDFAAVLSTKFKTKSKTIGKIAVNYYYLVDDDPAQSLELAVKTLETFSEIYSRYPYKQLSVVQTDFLHGGMEYGKLVYISAAFMQAATPDREQHNYVIVHEIAHQWWYGLVGNNQSHTAWIDEGLAEYSTVVFFGKHPEYKLDKATMVQNARANYSAYIRLIRAIPNAALDTSMERDLNAFNSSYEYVYMTYTRGLLLFCDIENLISEETLLAALSDFSHSVRFNIANRDKLAESLERVTGSSFKVFFETYLMGMTGLFGR